MAATGAEKQRLRFAQEGRRAGEDRARPRRQAWHLRERALPLRERAAGRGAPADLAALVHQMLEKTPSMRPVSALEVHDRLRDVRVGLRAPLLREARNAAPVERSIGWAPTQPMPASVRHDGGDPHTPGPAGGDRTAVLPAPVPAAATQPLVAPRIVARAEAPPLRPEARPEAPGRDGETPNPRPRRATCA